MYTYGWTKHKVFISYYHKDDQKYKDYIDAYLSRNIINKSVVEGEYDSENSDEYIKRLIREDKISDSSVVVVLVGLHTKERKHVDWEIYAALRRSINGSAGLIGILLPEICNFPNAKFYLPNRLADNVRSGYADLYEWGFAKNNFDFIIEESFNNRNYRQNKLDNSRIQMQFNG